MQGLSVAERDLELAPSEIQIYLLGPPRVEWHGQLLAIPRRQARALLYRLAAGDQPISRDGLSFLFWPDVGQATAGHNLSRLITILAQRFARFQPVDRARRPDWAAPAAHVVRHARA